MNTNKTTNETKQAASNCCGTCDCGTCSCGCAPTACECAKNDCGCGCRG